MPWSEIVGHQSQIAQFRRAVEQNRLASTFLFVGREGIGKRTFALQLAMALLCERSAASELEACGECPSCVQVAAGSHPDLELVAKPPDRSFIPIELLIGDREHRMREGLCHRISLKPSRGGRKIAIIDDADLLNVEGANSLLKTLEEPPPRSVLILIASNEQRQLPTIRSRSQIVRFRPLTPEQVQQVLLERKLIDDAQRAARAASLSGGSVAAALGTSDDALAAFREQLFDCWSRSGWFSVRLAADVVRFVEAAGKEASLRRQRLRDVLQAATEFYDALLRVLSGAEPPLEGPAQQAARTAAASWTAGSEAAAASLERCLEAELQLDANANVTSLVECWIDDLAQIRNGAAWHWRM